MQPQCLGMEDPTLRFVGILLEKHRASGDNLWKIADEPAIPGGVIVRFSLDVTGDEREEWFYRSTTVDHYWIVLSPQNDGKYNVLSTDVELGEGVGARIQRNEDQVILTHVWNRYPDVIHIFENRFRQDGSFQKNFTKIEGLAKVAARNRVDNWPKSEWGEEVKFENAQIIALEQFLKDDGGKWCPYDFKQNVLKQETLFVSADSDDKEMFTIAGAQKAYALLKEKSNGVVDRSVSAPPAPRSDSAHQSSGGQRETGKLSSPVRKFALVAALLILSIAGYRAISRRGISH